jgi:hypothetical protein
MKQAIILLLVLSLASCVGPEAKTSNMANPRRMELNNSSKYYDLNYRVYTLEGCEYILVGAGNNRWGSHKGNCKNPIHYTK